MNLTEVHRSPLSEETILEQVEEVKPVNRQLFRNSVLADDPVVEAEKRDPDRLYAAHDRNLKDEPNFAIIAEKPQHRLIVYLKAQGLSNKQVAEKTGLTRAWISQLTRQPWFRLRLAHELKEAGQDVISETLKSAALDSVYTLIDLRDDVGAPKAVRKASADSLLDRFLGKPTQHIEHEEKKLPTTPEITAIEGELKELETKLNGQLQPK